MVDANVRHRYTYIWKVFIFNFAWFFFSKTSTSDKKVNFLNWQKIYFLYAALDREGQGERQRGTGRETGRDRERQKETKRDRNAHLYKIYQLIDCDFGRVSICHTQKSYSASCNERMAFLGILTDPQSNTKPQN